MRTRSLLTTLACATVLAGAGAETAFADSSTTGQPAAAPSTSAPTIRPSVPPTSESRPSAAPSGVPSPSARPSRVGSLPSIPPPVPSTPGDRQIRVVPSGAPNTGVPPVASHGHGEAAAVGASLAVLLGGSGTLVARRRIKGRG